DTRGTMDRAIIMAVHFSARVLASCEERLLTRSECEVAPAIPQDSAVYPLHGSILEPRPARTRWSCRREKNRVETIPARHLPYMTSVCVPRMPGHLQYRCCGHRAH